jgi:hypothetical protein
MNSMASLARVERSLLKKNQSKKRLQWGMGLDIEHEIIEKVLS